MIMRQRKKIKKNKPVPCCQIRGRKSLELEIIRLSKLVVQKVQEVKDIRERLENLLKEKEQKQCFLEKEVEQRMQELEEKVQELEQFKKIAIGRELKMVELKEQLQVLKEGS